MWGSKPDESRPNVELLQDMVPWADYRLCLRALTVSGGDVSRAVDYLLSKEAALGGGKSEKVAAKERKARRKDVVQSLWNHPPGGQSLAPPRFLRRQTQAH